MKKQQLKQHLKHEIEKNAKLSDWLVKALLTIDCMKEQPSEQSELPEMANVIFNGPATIVLWKDSTKTTSKCREGDQYDPLFGMLACVVRKLTKNRGHGVDEHEEALRQLCKNIKEADDIKRSQAGFQLIATTLDVVSANEDKWLDQLGRPAQPSEKAVGVVADGAVSCRSYDRMTELEDRIDSIIVERERMRQKIRDLVDEGEL